MLRDKVGDLDKYVGERNAVQTVLGAEKTALCVVAHADVQVPRACAELGGEVGGLTLGEVLGNAAP